MSTIKKPEQFNLASVEVKGSKMKVSWIDEGNEHSRVSALPVHPDFKLVMNNLVSILTKYYDMEKADEYTSFKKVGVNNYEDDEGQSVQVKGVYSHPNGEQNTTISTAKIQTHQDAYGFETELKTCIGELADEACAYVFDNKSNQAEMDFEKEDEAA